MSFYVYDTKGNLVSSLEKTTSIQWLEKYNETGQFEIHVAPTENNIRYLIENNRVINFDTGSIGFIKFVECEKQDMTIRGFLDNLEDRINLQTAQLKSIPSDLKVLVLNNLRGLEVDVEEPTPIEDRPTVSETTWKSLRETISTVCKQEGWGYRMVRRKFLDEPEILNRLEFYEGVETNAIFSEDIGNAILENVFLDSKNYKNFAYVAGEGEGKDRKVVTVDLSNGAEKYEIYVDARDLTRKWTDDQNVEHLYSEAEYEAQLRSRGLKKLEEVKKEESFSFEILLNNKTFQYDVDYAVGDIVTVKSVKYGIQRQFRLAGIKTIIERGKKKIGIIEEV